MRSLIIDLETLGIADNSVVLQISAGIVDENGAKYFSAKLNARTQAESGRLIDPDTLRWWKSQSMDAQVRAFIPNKSLDISPLQACDDFEQFLKDNKYNKKQDFVWQRGSKDADWLSSLFTQNGWVFEKIPFAWWKVREIRTAVDVLGHSKKLNGYPDNVDELRSKIPNYEAHDSLSDVKLEIEILRMLGCASEAPAF